MQFYFFDNVVFFSIPAEENNPENEKLVMKTITKGSRPIASKSVIL